MKYDRKEIMIRTHEIRRITPAKTFAKCLRQPWAEAKELARIEERQLELERIRVRQWTFANKSKSLELA